MHEVFESIKTHADITQAVRKLVLEGKIPQNESSGLEKKITSLISAPPVADWFIPGNNILTEAEILIPSGSTQSSGQSNFKR